MVGLAATLTECEHIRRLIRRVDLVFLEDEPDAQPQYQWIRLLLPDTVHTMTIQSRFRPRDFTEAE